MLEIFGGLFSALPNHVRLLFFVLLGCVLYRMVRRANKVDKIETILLGLVGAVLVGKSTVHKHYTAVEDTLLLVIYLGGLMGITHIRMPALKSIGMYPVVAGALSSVMDSFLILLMINKIRISGTDDHVLKFKAYCMVAALLGGLTIYFGEVYALPLYLNYGMTSWYAALPIVPPVAVILAVLWYLTGKLKIRVISVSESDMDHVVSAPTQEHGPNAEDYVEFVLGIVLLLSTQNILLCCGVLFVYASTTGQGEDFIRVIKEETEVGIMLILILAWLIEANVGQYQAHFQSWLALVPSAANAVITGALFPVSGDIWRDITILSTGALLTPVSSLVGIMIFKTAREWREYMKISLPMAALWLLLSLSWFSYGWPNVTRLYQKVLGQAAAESSADKDKAKTAEIGHPMAK